ncbi:Rab3 GTPase-activating protein regulatory subunit [Sesamum angolense]|uniref:Rab3 GTPase-activating protein regulatory subunit n=1 Tax=Sesamum angolense TaxID=2727404 RepID=A0AAE2BIZ4_9LAMI|nr:Rab3 GTPase-activating protein regulatory subunit [Sesamum angolense]
MSRRVHTTELGCIAGEDLSDLGAGKEGWLVDNPNLLVSLDTHSLALANRSLILILHWTQSISGVPDQDTARAVKIRPDLSPIEAEYVSAVEWLVFDDDIRALAVGTSCGYLLIFSVHGYLIHRQIVNPGKILKIRVRGTKQDLTQDTSQRRVCINLLRRWFQETDSKFWDQEFYDSNSEDSGNSVVNLPYQLWNVSKYGLCADAAITGVMPPPLMEISQRYYCAVTIGDDAVISAFRLSVDKNRSLVGAILSKVVPATFSTIASFSKLIWRSEEKPTKKPEAKSQPFARASPLTCLKDHPRKDTQALVVVRLWKGYREASCLFVEMLARKDKAAASRWASDEHSKSDYCLCLAIHAPRKGIVEVWQMRTGPRLLTIPCPKGSKILQPTYRFSSATASSSSYAPLQVFFLNGDSGQISLLNPFLH